MFRLIKGIFIGAAIFAVALATVWAALALWYRLPFETLGRGVLAGGFGLLGVAVIAGLFRRRALRALTTFALALAAVILWWSTLTPPADRNWSPDVARQVTGTVEGDILTLENVRNFAWETPEDFAEAWETRSYDLAKLQSTDLFMSYWAGPQMAHMIVSFGFEGGDHIAWSVEVRRQLGGGFSPIADLFKSNTLVLIAADERDLVGTRTNARGEDVQLFRIGVSPDTGRDLLLKYVEAANSLAARPQWYNSLTTNCTTVVMALIRSFADEVPLDWRVLANGYLPEFAWEQGVLDQSRSVEDLRALGSITPIAQAHGVGPDYSAMIREGVPSPAQ
ncbi:DUF4105 domain-containing protein [Leisingera sp. SS27]|uniref:Lnb N-terminal periplasmic domain-containing protein n=1 Tax=Leisingera sp. SS27 TaxID=2979462 RepID=UPI0023305F02|nr:DUF4105 domain-containing protein [Leisingera sp. SS27]MDC0660709.1 DUF4105 domain-containing protein [Leisingera sp. SS27]